MRAYIKEDNKFTLCPYCITQDRNSLLPQDSALESKIYEGGFIKKIINKKTHSSENLINLLKYLAWENSVASCAIIAQLFLPTGFFLERLKTIKDIMDIKDSLRETRIRLAFSPSLISNKPCGFFKVIRDKKMASYSELRPYLEFFANCAREDEMIRDTILKYRRLDLFRLEEIIIKDLELTTGIEKMRKLLYTNEVNFGIPRVASGMRHGLDPSTEPVEMPDDQQYAELLNFKTYLTNYLILKPEKKESMKSQEVQKLYDDNLQLKAIYTYLALLKESQGSDVDIDEKAVGTIGCIIGKVAKQKHREKMRELMRETANPLHTAKMTNILNQLALQRGLSPLATEEKTATRNGREFDEEKIKQVMEFTGEPRERVISALKKNYWNADNASMELLSGC